MSFRIDLETPPEERWLPIIRIYKYKIKSAHDSLFLAFANFKSIQLFSKIISLSSYFGFVLHKKELESISQICGISFGDLVIAQIIYELSASCTSLIYKDPVSNEIIHFRTMDWPLHKLADLTTNVDFYKNNKLIYSCVTWAGFVGIMTSVKPNVGSVALNFRNSPDQKQQDIWQNISNIAKGKWPASYLIRFAMENANNNYELIGILKHNSLVAPCYFIIGHPSNIQQSITIIRDRDAFYIHKYNNNRLIQTNHDALSQKKPSQNILYSYQREIQCDNFLDRKHNLYQHPIINEETVFYTCLFPQRGAIGRTVIL